MGLGKKKKDGDNLPPPPGLPPMPMPPAPGMPMPPAPGMPMPPPPGMPMPPAPGAPLPPPASIAPDSPAGPPPVPTPQTATPPVAPPAPEPPAPAPAIEALPPSPASEPVVVVEEEDSYAGLYAKKSGKPLQQVYGHIDRISQGEIGSLLDRYSDRFGHELDRDIIVMRKEERDDKAAEIRDSPTVQLLNQEEEESSHLDGETLVELNNQLSTVEEELRRLKPEYQAAKEDGDRQLLRELRPSLETLMSERKLIKAVIAGEAELDELMPSDDDDEEEYEEEYEEESHVAEVADEEEDLFPYFVEIIDSFLGELPAEEVSAFTKSSGFETYRQVASSPDTASDDERTEFFSVVDSLLGGMPDDAVSEFTKSDDFEVYRAIGAMYS
ncbi:MAG: hypothetical protein CMB24_03055 [Euryarchaeota archaeon]|nr:hypothetical protein [Euryarchaeota archaeon]